MEHPVLRLEDGTGTRLDTARWHGEPNEADLAVLRAVEGPVLDVGCGPGRLVVGLARLGIMALGVDPAPGAVSASRRRGAAVLQRSVFDPLPGEGRWRTILLADGNIGIGGDPARLLRRCRVLAAPSGTVVVEVAPPGIGFRAHRARLERGALASPWFAWAEVGVDGIAELAPTAGLAVSRVERAAGELRWFAHLQRAEEASDAVA
ncbi:MAG TPA: class I SAM-dependent methyltransferase [Acidimicrobiales bacterium]